MVDKIGVKVLYFCRETPIISFSTEHNAFSLVGNCG